jgi:hypothetical protein
MQSIAMRRSATVLAPILAITAATFASNAIAEPPRAPSSLRATNTQTQFAGFGSTFSADDAFFCLWFTFIGVIVWRSRGSAGG